MPTPESGKKYNDVVFEAVAKKSLEGGPVAQSELEVAAVFYGEVPSVVRVRHGGMKGYITAKTLVLDRLRTDCLAIIGDGDEHVKMLAAATPHR